MGFLSWLFCVILVVALVLLLFPFAFRIDFEAGERGMRALFFFFKKKVYEYEKKWKEDAGSKELAIDSEKREQQDAPKSVTQDAPAVEAVAKKPADTPKTESMESSAGTELAVDNTQDTSLQATLTPSEAREPGAAIPEDNQTEPMEIAQPAEVKASSVVDVSTDAKVAEEPKPKKEKRKLSDREFWTIVLTPDFDARAFKYILKILKAVLTLFRVRFSDCFVEGIQTDYQTMGYIAAVNGFLKAYPYVGDWDLRMDWMGEKELRAVGSVRLSITLLRIFCFTLETLVLAGILALSFWRRRAHVIKTNELPQLGFIRRRILEFILED